MMQVLQTILEQAKSNKKRIVLPEWQDTRILEAAEFVASLGIATPVLVGKKERIVERLQDKKLFDTKIEIVDFPAEDFCNTLKNKYAKKKQLSELELANLLSDSIHQAALLLDAGLVDGMVAGIACPTAEVIRAAIRVIGLDQNYKTASSFFLMQLPRENNQFETLIFADCALVIEPDVQQLVDICLATLANSKKFLAKEPRVAMLSFSTEGSAKHPLSEKVAQATEIIKNKNPEIHILGEVQFDAAISREVATTKLKQQKFIEPSNIFIFPDLNSSNIGYKICQRLAHAKAIGPILQGFRLPVNDLSRGASLEDIVNLVALTSLQSQD